METRFKKKSQIVDITITAVAAVLSVGTMFYGISHLGLRDTWPELVLNLCYIACLVMMGLYFFKRLDSQRFNYWSSVCIGITVLLRDILFAPPLENYPIHLICLTLSVLLLLMLTFSMPAKTGRATPSVTCGCFLSLICSLPDCITMSLYTILSMNIPPTCSRKSGYARPLYMGWWHASCRKMELRRERHEVTDSFIRAFYIW